VDEGTGGLLEPAKQIGDDEVDWDMAA